MTVKMKHSYFNFPKQLYYTLEQTKSVVCGSTTLYLIQAIGGILSNTGA